MKLLDRVRGAMRTRDYSRRTEEAYVHWIRISQVTTPTMKDVAACSDARGQAD